MLSSSVVSSIYLLIVPRPLFLVWPTYGKPCSQEEGLSFIRLTNAGEEVVGYKTQGFLCARIMQVGHFVPFATEPNIFNSYTKMIT